MRVKEQTRCPFVVAATREIALGPRLCDDGGETSAAHDTMRHPLRRG